MYSWLPTYYAVEVLLDSQITMHGCLFKLTWYALSMGLAIKLLSPLVFASSIIMLTQSCYVEYAELFFHNHSSSRGHWRKTRYNGDWIICGGCAWWEHQGWDLLLCGGFDQVQPKLFGWCLGEDGGAGPNRSHQPLSTSRVEWSWGSYD